MTHPDHERHLPADNESSELSSHRLYTERAVFRPRPPVEVKHIASGDSELQSQSASSRDAHQAVTTLQQGEYRVAILFVGREALAALFPEDEARISALNDMEIESLAIELESIMAEIFRLALRLAWADYRTQVRRPR